MKNSNNFQPVKNPDGIIRVAIAGQGRSGYGIHASGLRNKTDQFKIVAVADQIPERRQDAIREFGAKAYEDYTELIEKGDFDLFVNALPTPVHVKATIMALSAGYHVVCEKPMARIAKEVDKMALEAVRAKRLLAPFQQFRLQPYWLKIQEIIASGVLGKILYVRSVWGSFNRRWDWQTLQCNVGGRLYNTGPHVVDHALMFFKENEMPKVFCRMYCHDDQLGGDAEDLCALTLYGKDAPLVEIFLTQYLAYPQGDKYCISGTYGGLSGNESQLRWKYYDPTKAPKQPFWEKWSVDRKYPGETLPWVEESWKVDENALKAATGYTIRSAPASHALFYDNIYDVLVNNGKLLITIPQVRKQIAVIEEAHRQNPLPIRRKHYP